MGSVSTLLSLIVGSLACIHTAKAEQWASVCLAGLGFRFFFRSSRTFQLLEFSNLPKIVVEGRERKEKEYVACVNMCTFVYFSCTNSWISLCLKSCKIARKLIKAN